MFVIIGQEKIQLINLGTGLKVELMKWLDVSVLGDIIRHRTALFLHKKKHHEEQWIAAWPLQWPYFSSRSTSRPTQAACTPSPFSSWPPLPPLTVGAEKRCYFSLSVSVYFWGSACLCKCDVTATIFNQTRRRKTAEFKEEGWRESFPLYSTLTFYCVRRFVFLGYSHPQYVRMNK